MVDTRCRFLTTASMDLMISIYYFFSFQASLLAAFSHQSEEVKSAASYALGNVALGNLQVGHVFRREISFADKFVCLYFRYNS